MLAMNQCTYLLFKERLSGSPAATHLDIMDNSMLFYSDKGYINVFEEGDSPLLTTVAHLQNGGKSLAVLHSVCHVFCLFHFYFVYGAL